MPYSSNFVFGFGFASGKCGKGGIPAGGAALSLAINLTCMMGGALAVARTASLWRKSYYLRRVQSGQICLAEQVQKSASLTRNFTRHDFPTILWSLDILDRIDRIAVSHLRSGTHPLPLKPSFVDRHSANNLKLPPTHYTSILASGFQFVDVIQHGLSLLPRPRNVP